MKTRTKKRRTKNEDGTNEEGGTAWSGWLPRAERATRLRTAADIRAVNARLVREIRRDQDPHDFNAPLFKGRLEWNRHAHQALGWCLEDKSEERRNEERGRNEGVKPADMIRRQHAAASRAPWRAALLWVLNDGRDRYGDNVVAPREWGDADGYHVAYLDRPVVTTVFASGKAG